jgi:ABC-type siderophore export system fused ATPase/permease subunit
MGILKKSAESLVFLTGKTNLKNTKAHLSEAKRIVLAYKDMLVKDRTEDLSTVDAKASEKAEYLKRFRNFRIVTSMILFTAIGYVYYVALSPNLFELVCRLMTAAIFSYLYIALARYMTKLRLAYQVLPGRLSEKEGSITWSKFATMVANKPSLLLPLKLDC